jgi:hypothetical protein
MKRERLMLKRPAGWFAAGPEFVAALELLPRVLSNYMSMHVCRLIVTPGVSCWNKPG